MNTNYINILNNYLTNKISQETFTQRIGDPASLCDMLQIAFNRKYQLQQYQQHDVKQKREVLEDLFLQIPDAQDYCMDHIEGLLSYNNESCLDIADMICSIISENNIEKSEFQSKLQQSENNDDALQIKIQEQEKQLQIQQEFNQKLQLQLLVSQSNQQVQQQNVYKERDYQNQISQCKRQIEVLQQENVELFNATMSNHNINTAQNKQENNNKNENIDKQIDIQLNELESISNICNKTGNEYNKSLHDDKIKTNSDQIEQLNSQLDQSNKIINELKIQNTHIQQQFNELLIKYNDQSENMEIIQQKLITDNPNKLQSSSFYKKSKNCLDQEQMSLFNEKIKNTVVQLSNIENFAKQQIEFLNTKLDSYNLKYQQKNQISQELTKQNQIYEQLLQNIFGAQTIQFHLPQDSDNTQNEQCIVDVTQQLCQIKSFMNNLLHEDQKKQNLCLFDMMEYFCQCIAKSKQVNDLTAGKHNIQTAPQIITILQNMFNAQTQEELVYQIQDTFQEKQNQVVKNKIRVDQLSDQLYEQQIINKRLNQKIINENKSSDYKVLQYSQFVEKLMDTLSQFINLHYYQKNSKQSYFDNKENLLNEIQEKLSNLIKIKDMFKCGEVDQSQEVIVKYNSNDKKDKLVNKLRESQHQLQEKLLKEIYQRIKSQLFLNNNKSISITFDDCLNLVRKEQVVVEQYDKIVEKLIHEMNFRK